MPRRAAIALALTGLALALLLSFKTPDAPTFAASAADGTSGGASAVPGPSAAASAPPGSSDRSGSSGAGSTPTPAPTDAVTAYRDGTVDGPVVNMRYGPVQVEVTISGGEIVDVAAVQLPWDHPRSVELSEYAAAVLREQVLQAQTASVDLVSGATYTSAAYVRSLQAALDEAQA